MSVINLVSFMMIPLITNQNCHLKCISHKTIQHVHAIYCTVKDVQRNEFVVQFEFIKYFK